MLTDFPCCADIIRRRGAFGAPNVRLISAFMAIINYFLNIRVIYSGFAQVIVDPLYEIAIDLVLRH